MWYKQAIMNRANVPVVPTELAPLMDEAALEVYGRWLSLSLRDVKR